MGFPVSAAAAAPSSKEEEETVVAARLFYRCNGDNDAVFERAFARLRTPPQVVLDEDTGRIVKYIVNVYMSVYPLDTSLCNEYLFLLRQQLGRGDYCSFSALDCETEDFYFFAFFEAGGAACADADAPPEEMIGLAMMPAPVIEEEESVIRFSPNSTHFVFFLPGTPLFPTGNHLEDPVLFDARVGLMLADTK